MAVKITYFGHSTTTDNEQGLATGWEQGELSQTGIEQAKRLGELVSNRHFDAVFSSDLKRAIDSARLVFRKKYRLIQDKRLRECDYGDSTGKPSKEFKDEERMIQHIDKPFPNGESYKDVERRMADFLKSLKNNYDGKHIAIFSHQAPHLALDVLVKGRTWEQAIDEDWRKTKAWQPGWEYTLE
jgi:broad specificity phosphatase PhoE